MSNNYQKPAFPSQQKNHSQRKAGLGVLQVWYYLTSPPEPDALASLQDRELFRRGRTGSQISIFLFLLIFISYPAAFAGSNSLLIFILTLNLFFLAVAMFLNHLKLVTLAGIIVVLGTVMSPTANIVTTPGGINTSALPVFGFLVLAVMCTVSFLPPVWVFAVAAGNSLFTVLVLRFLASSGELHTVLATTFPGIVTPILLSQWIVAVVAFLWVRGAKLAIQRADRAEEIVKLQQEINWHTLERTRHKEQLEQSIHVIEETHASVANGNLSARAPLNEDNVLWGISGQLNNLLSRYQQLHIEIHQFQQQRFALERSMRETSQLQTELRQVREKNVQLQRQLHPGSNQQRFTTLPLNNHLSNDHL